MNCICIAGAIDPALRLVSNILQDAGMQRPKPAQIVDFESWHEQVTATVIKESGVAQPLSEIGLLWERLASDVILANRDSLIWGWADTRSTWLLEFWRKFELRLNFVLVCVTPEQMLSGLIASDAAIPPMEIFMNRWQSHHRELLRFARENPQRGLLVDAYDCAANPGALIELCSRRWKLPFANTAATSSDILLQDPLALYLARQVCRDHPQIAELQKEVSDAITRMTRLDMVATPPGLRSWAAKLFKVRAPDEVSSLYAPPPEEMIASFRALRNQSTQLKSESVACEELRVANARLLDDAGRLARQQADTEAKFRDDQDRQRREYDALLLQLHQVQEELEATFLRHESKQSQIDVLTQERDSHAKQATERLAGVGGHLRMALEETR